MIESAKLRMEKKANIAQRKVDLLYESGINSHLMNILAVRQPIKNQTWLLLILYYKSNIITG